MDSKIPRRLRLPGDSPGSEGSGLGQVDRQRRRACGVYATGGPRRSRKYEAVGDDAHRATAIAQAIDLRQIGGSHRTVFAQACPGKLLLPSGATCQAGLPRAPTLPSHFQQLEVHLVGFMGDLEEFRVEGVDARAKMSPAVVRASCGLPRVARLRRLPSLRQHLADRGTAFTESPQCFWARNPARNDIPMPTRRRWLVE